MSSVANDLAKEFGWRAIEFFTPAITEEKRSVNAIGKFVNRVDYVRKQLQLSGLLETTSPKEQTEENTDARKLSMPFYFYFINLYT